MTTWKTLVFPCLLVSASLIAALPQRREGSHEIDHVGSLFEAVIDPGTLDFFSTPSKNNLTVQLDFENREIDLGSNMGSNSNEDDHHHGGNHHGGSKKCCISLVFLQTQINGK
jgi:hypothetical protein